MSLADPGVVSEWMHGRAHCATCRIVAAVIYHPEAEVRCPRCGALADLGACGDEAGLGLKIVSG